VDPDRDIRPLEICKSASVVKVKMTHDNSLHILDVVPGLGDLYIKLLILRVIDSSKDVIKWSAPDLRIIWACTSLEQNQLSGSVSSKPVSEILRMYPFRWMLDQDRDNDSSTAHRFRIGVAFGGRSTLCLVISSHGWDTTFSSVLRLWDSLRVGRTLYQPRDCRDAATSTMV
jgi:hypothetical protein